MVAIGEVGLAGEIRGVTGIQRRLAEADRMGFRRAIVPPGSGYVPAAGPGGRMDGTGRLTDVREAADVREAIAAALGG
jgi:DNA repair protein RadA/Sms